MIPESPTDEAFIREGFEDVALSRPAEAPTLEEAPPRPNWILAGGLTLGSIALSVAATFIARRVAPRLWQVRRRRAALVSLQLQPRVAIFAPTTLISLPFSGIAGKVPANRGRGRRAERRREREHARQATGRRMWLRRAGTQQR
jgi:hypothetical protein